MDCDFNPQQNFKKVIKKSLQDVEYYVKTTNSEINQETYNNKEENERHMETDESGNIIYYEIKREEQNEPSEGYTLEIRNELANVLDSQGQIQWEDSAEMEFAYDIRYLDANGNITNSEQSVYVAAFVGCTYHCG